MTENIACVKSEESDVTCICIEGNIKPEP